MPVSQTNSKVIYDALKACDWNQTEAAKRLGMPLRTLVRRISSLNIKKLGFGVD